MCSVITLGKECITTTAGCKTSNANVETMTPPNGGGGGGSPLISTKPKALQSHEALGVRGRVGGTCKVTRCRPCGAGASGYCIGFRVRVYRV